MAFLPMATICASPMSIKIFTNVHSAIVDPKDFTPDSFVDFQGEVCIIPPNSFALPVRWSIFVFRAAF